MYSAFAIANLTPRAMVPCHPRTIGSSFATTIEWGQGEDKRQRVLEKRRDGLQLPAVRSDLWSAG
jgi:hypothetical protein